MQICDVLHSVLKVRPGVRLSEFLGLWSSLTIFVKAPSVIQHSIKLFIYTF